MKIKLKQPQKLTDESPNPVTGKFFGRPMGKVPASWLDWFIGQEHLKRKYPNVATYIEANWRVIQQELADPAKYGVEDTWPDDDTWEDDLSEF